MKLWTSVVATILNAIVRSPTHHDFSGTIKDNSKQNPWKVSHTDIF